MGKIALIPCGLKCRELYLGNLELPMNYMGDFTVMGLVVDRYQEAVNLLTSTGYQLREKNGGADIFIDTPLRLAEIKACLEANSISCDLSDIADTFYQA